MRVIYSASTGEVYGYQTSPISQSASVSHFEPSAYQLNMIEQKGLSGAYYLAGVLYFADELQGQVIEGGTLRYETPQETYARQLAEVHEARKAAYPPIADQMDMQYWDSVNGTTTWTDAINGVKSLHPLPPQP